MMAGGIRTMEVPNCGNQSKIHKACGDLKSKFFKNRAYGHTEVRRTKGTRDRAVFL